jgi:uncharacterized protein
LCSSGSVKKPVGAASRFHDSSNAFNSALLLSVFWAIWHVPLFLYRPGYAGMDLSGMAGWCFSMLMGSVLLTWLFNSSKGSILVCAIFHAFVDVAFTSYLSNDRIVNITGLLITIYAIAVLIIFRPEHLSFSDRVKTV